MSMTQPFNTPLFMPRPAPLPQRSSSTAVPAAAKEEPSPTHVLDQLGESLTNLFSPKTAPQPPPPPAPEPELAEESLAERVRKFLFFEEPLPSSPASAEPPPSKEQDWSPGQLLQAIQRDAEEIGQAIQRP